MSDDITSLSIQKQLEQTMRHIENSPSPDAMFVPNDYKVWYKDQLCEIGNLVENGSQLICVGFKDNKPVVEIESDE